MTSVRGRDAPGPLGALTRSSALLVAITVLLAVATACGSGGGTARPRTPARLEIAAPAPNAVVGPETTVRLVLHGARLVPGTQAGGAIRPRLGHVHISVDGQVVAMVNRLDYRIAGLAPGQHTVDAEFVASDHLPFANRVVAVTEFRVA